MEYRVLSSSQELAKLFIKAIFKQESGLASKVLEDGSELGLGFEASKKDINDPIKFSYNLVLLDSEWNMRHGPKFENENEAKRTYRAISSKGDFEKYIN